MSPPTEQRDKYKLIAERWGGCLRENEIYRDTKNSEVGYVLVEMRAEDSQRAARMLKEMGAGPGTLELHDREEATETDGLLPPEESAASGESAGA